MTDVTNEQRAAWARLSNSPDAAGTTGSLEDDVALIVPLLPDSLTNPQPALPTEPGAFLDRYNHAVQLDEEGRWWYGTENYDPSGAGPFTRLVPERPQVTREQLNRACLAEEVAAVNFRQARAILNFVNGTRA